MSNTKMKFYLGDIIIRGIQVSAFAIAPTKKRAAEIFNCNQNYITKNFEIWDINEVFDDERFNIAICNQEKLFVSNSVNDDNYRLFLDDERFLSSNNLIIDIQSKINFIKEARKSKSKFIKVRLKDNIALEQRIFMDLYFDLSNSDEIKRLFYIPFNKRLIDENWQHRAIETNHELDEILMNMFDIYKEKVISYSVNEALDFYSIG